MAVMELHQERTTTREASTMKAIVHERYGMPDVLELRDVDLPAIEDDQVLLRVHASSVNPVEWYGVTGPFFVRLFGGGLRRPKSTTVGADVAGVVEAVGKDVTEFQPGDEVFGTSGAAWAEYAPAREVRLVRKPANVSFEEAAAVPIAAITALQALRDKGGVQPGQKVLINGASGGVGTFAVQIAKALGADVTAVCSTRNVDLVRVARGRPRRRLHPGGLHAAQRAPRPDDRHRRQPAVQEVQARADTQGDSRGGRGEVPVERGHRTAVARDRNALAALGRSQTVKFFVAKINKDDLERPARAARDRDRSSRSSTDASS